MLQDFKKFILRGNTIDLAVAVVVGAAFGAVVTALVKDIFTPLIAAIVGKPNFSGLTFTVNHSQFLYGDFINAVIAFVLIASVIFFFIIQPTNKLVAISNRKKTTPDPTTKKCPECLSEVPLAATRCAFCTTKLLARA